MKKISKHSDSFYASLRIIAGFMFTCHGLQKILGILAEHPGPDLGSQIWVGGIIELVCGLMIALGFHARWAAFLASGTMAVAYMQFHWKFQLGREFFPIINKGEVAVLYCFLFLFIASRGGVKWCLNKN